MGAKSMIDTSRYQPDSVMPLKLCQSGQLALEGSADSLVSVFDDFRLRLRLGLILWLRPYSKASGQVPGFAPSTRRANR